MSFIQTLNFGKLDELMKINLDIQTTKW